MRTLRWTRNRTFRVEVFEDGFPNFCALLDELTAACAMSDENFENFARYLLSTFPWPSSLSKALHAAAQAPSPS